jgi:tRNA-2-methylthio-N6-dimethylallyladenosine synthase
MKYFLKTFGCQMNISDSERVESVLRKMGWQKIDFPEEADLIILNSCSVRQ